MRNKNLTAAAAMATATALMLAGCATQKPAASSSEAASTAPAESSMVEETTPEEVPSEVTDVDEAAAEDLLLSTETMHYSADDEDGAVMVAGILTDGKGTPRISKELVQNFERKCGATICKDLKGIGTGKVLCPCPECVRNAVLSLGEALGE